MTTPKIKSNKYTTIARLFKLVSNISEEQLLILLKELLKDHFTTYLFRLIIEMSDDQQLMLMKQLEETSVKSGNLDKRSRLRKPCLVNVDYIVGKRKFKSFMLDISPAGAFIETDEAFFTGQQIKLSFTLPNAPQPLNISGEILWKGMLGIGVKFNDLTDEQIAAITTFIEEEEI